MGVVVVVDESVSVDGAAAIFDNTPFLLLSLLLSLLSLPFLLLLFLSS